MSKLMQVAKGQMLRLPEVIHGPDRFWLNEGGVIDLDEPGIEEAVKGQEYKLIPAAPEADPSPMNPRIGSLLAARAAELAKVDPKVEATKKATARAAETGLSSGIPKPDERPKAKSPKVEGKPEGATSA